jgi:(2R)-sulfolactate sulfo-lyase subunit alpha
LEFLIDSHQKFTYHRAIKREGGSGMVDFLIHDASDNVGVATRDIQSGQTVSGLFMDSEKTTRVKALKDIPLGHKIALKNLKSGEGAVEYGHDIGKIVADVKKGEHVHIHNLKTRRW